MILPSFHVLKAIFQKNKQPYLEWIGLKKTAIDYKAILLISASYLVIALLPAGWLYQGGQMNNADALTVKAYLANGLDVQTLLVILLWVVHEGEQKRLYYIGFLRTGELSEGI